MRIKNDESVKQGKDLPNRRGTRFERFVQTVNIPIYGMNKQGEITLFNRKCEEITGYSQEEVLGKNVFHFLIPEDKQTEVQQGLKHFISGTTPTYSPEIAWKTKTGEQRTIKWDNSFLRDEKGSREEILGIGLDVIDKKQVQEAKFLVDLMAHDLTNINQGLLLSLEMLQLDSQLSTPLKKRIDDLISQLERSTELIANVRRFQSLDTEPSQLGSRDIFPAFWAAVNAVERAFPQKKLVIKSDFGESKYWILADGFLTELFFNILHNAMKFDRNEEVIVEVDVKEEPKKGHVKVEIKDRGPGIPDSDKKRILGRLLLQDEKIWGSGIGLTLVARIAERYDAKISVKDRVKDDHTQGATFIIEFHRGDSR